MFDFETVIRGCEILKSMGRKYRLLVCGKGERLEEYKRACSGNESIRFLGWLTATQLGAVLSISHVGLNPMPERFDFIASINNKAAEYMCGGVPILMTPARGALFDLLNRESIGLAYPSGDAQGFAEMIVRMQDHSQERLRMAENARKLFKRSFWDAVVYKEFVNRMASIV